MGIEKLVEELGGAFAAEKALEAANPDANLVEKAAAAFVGFEGGGILGDALGNLLHKDGAPAEQPAAEGEASA